MASLEKNCDSCGKIVRLSEIESGEAFSDGEHTYCPNCVAKVVSKVREIQNGNCQEPKQEEVGAAIYMLPASVSEKKNIPRWVLIACAVETVAAVILAILLVLPRHIPIPTAMPDEVSQEKTIRAMITEAESSLSQPGSTKELIQYYESALKRAAGTLWVSEIRRKMTVAKAEYEKGARTALAQLKTAFDAAVAQENYTQAEIEIDKFPAQFRDYEICREQISAMRQQILLLLDARRDCSEILIRADDLWRKEKPNEALEVLSSFPEKYKDTVYAARIRLKKDEIGAFIAEVTARKEAEEKHRQEEAEDLRRRTEEAQKAREEAEKRWVEEEIKRIEEAKRRAEEEARRIAEEQARAKEPSPDEQLPKGEKEDEKEPWTEVELKPVIQKEFPFITPFEQISPLVAGPKATTTLKFLPLPNEGRKFGLGVEDRQSFVEVDSDGDGQFETRLPSQGGNVVLKLSYGKEEGEVLYAVDIVRVGNALGFRRNSCMAGKFQNMKLFLIDDNNNGFFNDYGKDALVIGNNFCACTLANVMSMAGKLYEIKVSSSGKKIFIRPFVAEKLGKLNLCAGFKAKGTLLFGVVFGTIKDKNGKEITAAFDLAGHAKGIDIPVGSYSLVSGGIGYGEKLAVRISGTKNCKDIVITESSVVKIDWGAPARLEFSYQIDTQGNLTVRPDSIRIFGSYGEEYYDYNVDDFIPSVQVRDENTGAIVLTRSFAKTDDGKGIDVFQSLVPAGVKLKVRVFGKSRFLGDITSEWK